MKFKKDPFGYLQWGPESPAWALGTVAMAKVVEKCS